MSLNSNSLNSLFPCRKYKIPRHICIQETAIPGLCVYMCICVYNYDLVLVRNYIISATNIKDICEIYIMAHANNDIVENLFYNIMMNMQEDMIMFQEGNQFGAGGSVINQSLYDSNPIKMVISEEEKNKLVTIKYKDATNKEQNTACFITQDDFQEEDDIIQLPCNHCFTPDSIMHWLTEECAECPVCRHKFDSVEKRVEPTPEEVDDDMPELIPIDQPIINNVFEIDDINQVNNFRNIFLNNLFNSMSEESNMNFNYIHQYSNHINFNNHDEEDDEDDEEEDDSNNDVDEVD